MADNKKEQTRDEKSQLTPQSQFENNGDKLSQQTQNTYGSEMGQQSQQMYTANPLQQEYNKTDMVNQGGQNYPNQNYLYFTPIKNESSNEQVSNLQKPNFTPYGQNLEEQKKNIQTGYESVINPNLNPPNQYIEENRQTQTKPMHDQNTNQGYTAPKLVLYEPIPTAQTEYNTPNLIEYRPSEKRPSFYEPKSGYYQNMDNRFPQTKPTFFEAVSYQHKPTQIKQQYLYDVPRNSEIREGYDPVWVRPTGYGQLVEPTYGFQPKYPSVINYDKREPDLTNYQYLADNKVGQTFNIPGQSNNVAVDANYTPVQTSNVHIQSNNVPMQPNNVPIQSINAPMQPNNVLIQSNNVPMQPNNVPIQSNNIPMQPNNVPIQSNNIPTQSNNIQGYDAIVKQRNPPYGKDQNGKCWNYSQS